MKKFFFNNIIVFISLIIIHSTVSKNLCPNNPLINVGYMSTTGLSFISIDEAKLKSKINQEEREDYEDMIELKRAFSASMNIEFDKFSPEKDDYWSKLNNVTLVFFSISLFPIIIIILYLILRFLIKKCTGPRKPDDITRLYRNLTWVSMIISVITVFILFTIILAYSVQINNAVKRTFNEASKLIESNSNIYDEIKKATDNNKNLVIQDNEILDDFKKNIENYIETTKEHTNEIKSNDNHRNVGMILLYVYYLIMIILSFTFFFLKWKVAEGILFIVFLFTIPAMVIFEGYNTKYFFYYADLCETINGALYHNEFPVSGQSLGYYYNCFDKQTKAELYGIRYSLYNSAFSSINLNDSKTQNEYNELNSKIIVPQLNCGLVNNIVPYIEEDFCKDKLKKIYNMIKLMNWLLLFTFLTAVCVRKMENLIWKKKNDIESRIENLEQIY